MILAVILMAIVAIGPYVLWPPKPADRQVGGPADSAAAGPTVAAPAAEPPAIAVRPPSGPAVAADTVWVSSGRYRFGFSTRGAALVAAELRDYRSFSAADSGRPVQLVPTGRPFLQHHLVFGADTVALND